MRSSDGSSDVCSSDLIVVEGRIWLELDDGTEVELHAGDVAVQQGNRHACRTKGEGPATMAFFLVGPTMPCSRWRPSFDRRGNDLFYRATKNGKTTLLNSSN